MAVQYAYDGQVRRFVLQFIRLLSNFQVEFGQDANGDKTLQTVPIYYGDQSRQAAMILRGNSENTLNAVRVNVSVPLGVESELALSVRTLPFIAVTVCPLTNPVPLTTMPTLIVPVTELTVKVLLVMLV